MSVTGVQSNGPHVDTSVTIGGITDAMPAITESGFDAYCYNTHELILRCWWVVVREHWHADNTEQSKACADLFG